MPQKFKDDPPAPTEPIKETPSGFPVKEVPIVAKTEQIEDAEPSTKANGASIAQRHKNRNFTNFNSE